MPKNLPTRENARSDNGNHEWRAMKVATIAKRERGDSALPEATVSVAVTAIESKPEFQERCKTWSCSKFIDAALFSHELH